MVNEFIVFIHGITCQGKPAPHNSDYNNFNKGVAANLPQNSEWNKAGICFTEWGWNYDNQTNPTSHKVLSGAQNIFADRVLQKVNSSKDFTLNPLRIALNPMRKLMLYGFSDMFYYVSSEGKLAVRTSICEQIVQALANKLDDDNSLISLTLIGHSAGSVIAIDISYYLFSGKVYDFVISKTSPDTEKAFRKLKQKAEAGKLRLRRLVTLRSPISMLACRKDAVVELLAAGKRIDPALHGITASPNFEEVTGPRWIKIWEKGDPIALPIEPLMNSKDKLVEDVLLHSTDFLSKAHNIYWSSSRVHKIVANRWLN